MAESSNGEAQRAYKDVAVEDATEEPRDASLADAAEKIFGGDKSSSSSSSSDDEKESDPVAAATEVCVEVVEASSVEAAPVVENDVLVEETTPETVVEQGEACVVEKIAEAEAGLPVGEEDAAKTVEESVCVAASEAAVESAQIPESTAYTSGAGVSRQSMEAASWKSCCGLFEVLNRSQR